MAEENVPVEKGIVADEGDAKAASLATNNLNNNMPIERPMMMIN